MKKLFTTTFWIVMAIHIVVFTSIGLSGRGWRWLIIFVCSLALTLIFKHLIINYIRKNRTK